LYTFASPFYIKNVKNVVPAKKFVVDDAIEDGNTITFGEIDHNDEFRRIMKTMKSIRKNVRYKKILATSFNLEGIRHINPCVFHFSGHGIKNASSENGEKDFLIIENEKLLGDILNKEDITKYFVNIQSIRVALILSCQSLWIGQFFQSCGIEHVICVDRDKEIDDISWVIFTETFYKRFFDDEKTVCEAFSLSVDAVKNKISKNGNKTQADMFNLLQIKSHDMEDCTSNISCVANMPTQNLSIKPKIKKLPETPKKLIGRNEFISTIYEKLDKHDRILLSGQAGIGKSAIVMQLAHKIFERDIFADGVLYISLEGCQDSGHLLEKFFSTVLDAFISKVSRRDLKEYTNHSTSAKFNACLQAIKEFQILIIFDNCDCYISTRENDFMKFLNSLKENIPNCGLIVTSRKFSDNIGHLFFKVDVKKLKNQDTLQLIKNPAKSKDVISKELVELYNTTSEKDKIKDWNDKKLLKHDLFKIIDGIPLCALHISSLSIGKLPSHILEFKMINIYKDLCGIWNRLKNEPQDSNFNLSFKMTMNTSLMSLKNNEQTMKGLRCLALWPGGLKLKDLKTVVTQDWNIWIKSLVDKNIVKEHVWEEGGNPTSNFIEKA